MRFLNSLLIANSNPPRESQGNFYHFSNLMNCLKFFIYLMYEPHHYYYYLKQMSLLVCVHNYPPCNSIFVNYLILMKMCEMMCYNAKLHAYYNIFHNQFNRILNITISSILYHKNYILNSLIFAVKNRFNYADFIIVIIAYFNHYYQIFFSYYHH